MIDEPPLLTVRERFPRPDPAAVAALHDAITGWVGDAMGGRGAMDPAIKPIVAAAPRAVGVAVTCRCGPDDNLAAFGAIAIARPGDVIVCAAEGFTGSGMAGDLMMGMARNAGCAGFVTDGMVRDLAGLEAVGLPVFARGLTPSSCVRNGPGTVGLPVVVGGVPVEAGDVIVADRDGVVVVPQARLAATLERIEQVKRAEAALEAKVKAGLVVMDSIRALLDGPRTVRVD